MGEKRDWIINLDMEMSSDELRKHCIYKVPAHISCVKKVAYTPKVVSIGPYHHGRQELEAMEIHKHRALLHFIRRSRVIAIALFQIMQPMLKDLKDAYDQLDPYWVENDDKFLEMMILDGCFIVEISRFVAHDANAHEEHSSDEHDYPSNDPIFSKHGSLYALPYLRRDMMLVENQIPMPVINKLSSLLPDAGKLKNKARKILRSFHVFPEDEKIIENSLHLLDMYRKVSTIEIQSRHAELIPPPKDVVIIGATELHEAGVVLKRARTQSLCDISFRRGVLTLPEITIDDDSELLFLNMIAYEQLHVGAGNEVSSYVIFMSIMMGSVDDVKLLGSKGIVRCGMREDKVIDLFNSLSSNLIWEPSSQLRIVLLLLNGYCGKAWNRWRANLVHNYLTEKWSVVSGLVLGMTLVQTVYAVLAYTRPRP